MDNSAIIKNIIKRILYGAVQILMLLICSMCLFCTDITYAADKIASGVCGDNLTWTIDEDYVLTINGTGDMYNYGQTSSTGGPAPWIGYVNSIIKVEISEGVTSIGSFAFYNCRGAYSINIPSTVSNFGRYSFYNCSGISKINIPVNLESLGVGTFRGCTGLTSAVVPSGITIIPVQAFSECGIRSVTLPNSIKEIDESAFSACGNLQSIALPEGLEIIGENAFTGAGLTTLEIPSTVRTIGKGVCKSKSLSAIHVNDENDYYKDVDGVLLSKDGKTLILFPYQKGGYSVDYSIPDSVEIIESDAFHYGMESSQPNMNTTGYPMNINSITVPEGITSLESYSLYCFIENLYLPQSLKKLKMYSVARANNVYLKTCMAPMAHATAFYSGITNVHAPESSIGYDVNPWASGTVVYDMPSAHIWNEEYTTDKAATCKEEGSKSIHCSVCDSVDESTVTVIPKSDHTYGDWTVTKEATCTEDGSKEKVCSVCEDKVTEVIPATGHLFSDEFTTDTEPTCTAEGSKSKHCTKCNAIDESSVTVMSALGHNWDSGKITTEPTCTDEGVKTFACNRCEETKTEVVPATGHSFSDEFTTDTEPTCTAEGSKSKHCTKCNAIDESSVTVIPVLGHNWDSGKITTEPTCTDEGVKTFACSRCEETKTEVIPATGHSFSDEFTTDTEPTCTAEGSKSKHCTKCDAVTEVTTIPANGHTFGPWEEVTPSTCEGAGSHQHRCEVCGFTEAEATDPTGHDIEENYTIDVPATCTGDGSQSKHCKNCEVTFDSQVIPATGHNYGDWKTTLEPTCTEKGSKEQICSTCKNKVTQDIPALGHVWNEEPTVEKEATCTETGSQSIHCARCNETRDAETIPALGHDWSTTPTVDKKATCTEDGKESTHCTRCDAAQEGSEKAIPATGHKFSSWTTTKKATEIAAGQQTRKCSVCGKTEAQTVAQLNPTLPAVKIATPKAAKKSATIKWKKVSKAKQKKIGSIQIQYSLDKTFKTGVKTVTAKKSAASKKVTKLKSKKKYYVRIRAYKKSGGVVHVSKWSTVKSVKIK